ncbi:MAG: hypothetical protein WD276_09995 [Actinomycetota bacterium]
MRRLEPGATGKTHAREKHMLTELIIQAARRLREQSGAVGWLIVGVLLGIVLIVFLIIKFLIPGE